MTSNAQVKQIFWAVTKTLSLVNKIILLTAICLIREYTVQVTFCCVLRINMISCVNLMVYKYVHCKFTPLYILVKS